MAVSTLDGKIALVTGGNRGIGAAISLALAEAGCDVAVNFRSRAEEAEKICSEIRGMGRRAITVQAECFIIFTSEDDDGTSITRTRCGGYFD